MPRCMDCGRQQTSPAGVGLRKTAEGVVGFAGLATCGRVWLCPVCNAKVMARRAMEIGAALTWATVEGYQVIFGSLTCRHNIHTPLGGLIEIQQKAWRHVVQSRFWSKQHNATATVEHEHVESCPWECERKRDTVLTGKRGRVGYIRASEITVGRNGWHPHFHPIIIYKGTQEQAQSFADEVVRLWVEGVELAGGSAEIEGGQQLRVRTGVRIFDDLGAYVTKATYDPSKLALEAVWSQSKWGRGRAIETVSHWALLASIENGEYAEAEQWRELESATDGHRMITWSRGLRRFAGLMDQEKDDEEIAAEEVGTVEDTLAVITTAGWMEIRDRPEVLALVLDQLEVGGIRGATAILDAYGIEWAAIEQLADAYGASDTVWVEPKGKDRARKYTAEAAPAWVDPELAGEIILGERKEGRQADSIARRARHESRARYIDEKTLGHGWMVEGQSQQERDLAVLDALLATVEAAAR